MQSPPPQRTHSVRSAGTQCAGDQESSDSFGDVTRIHSAKEREISLAEHDDQLTTRLTKSARAEIHRGVDLISDALPFGRLWYGEPNAIRNAVNYARFYSRSHDAVIRVYDEAGEVIETHEQAGDFAEP